MTDIGQKLIYTCCVFRFGTFSPAPPSSQNYNTSRRHFIPMRTGMPPVMRAQMHQQMYPNAYQQYIQEQGTQQKLERCGYKKKMKKDIFTLQMGLINFTCTNLPKISFVEKISRVIFKCFCILKEKFKVKQSYVYFQMDSISIVTICMTQQTMTTCTESQEVSITRITLKIEDFKKLQQRGGGM